jgi:hypothetical protein
MPTTLETKPSTPRLSEAARYFVLPSGIVATGWPQVVARGRELGISFDWWQDSLGRAVLSKRQDGKYAATVGGVVLSIPRQVGKTYFVLAVLVIMCTLFPGLRVLWTAHHNRTTTNSFRTLQGLCRRKRIAAQVKSIRVANGEQEIRFCNGSIIMFGAREQGFGRGFDEIDIEVFDEAQILTEKALEDMVAATNQARHPHGALLFYMGTPPRPTDPGEAFWLKRERALSGKSDDLVYLECSADSDADPDDRGQWEKANFSFPVRTPLESMLRLRENLGNEDSWLREGLGIWDAEGTQEVISPSKWRACVDEISQVLDPVAFAVDVTPDRSSASIAVAGRRKDGRRHIEVLENHKGTGWATDRLAELAQKWDGLVVLDASGPAGSLIPGLREAGIEPQVTSAREMGQACGLFYDLVHDTQVVHLDQGPLNVAVSAARKRALGDAWAWHRKDATVDISPLVAVTLALFGHDQQVSKKPKRTGKVW